MHLQQSITSHVSSRDILNFIKLRVTTPEDDDRISSLLLKAFIQTHASKLPHVSANQDRINDLLNTSERRRDGDVIALELGYRIIGTFALIRPNTRQSDSWISNAATLRCLAVDPEYHGLGFSSVLIAEAERLSTDWQVDSICLQVHKGAEGVAKLYCNHGYYRDPSGDAVSYGNPVEGYTFTFKQKNRSS